MASTNQSLERWKRRFARIPKEVRDAAMRQALAEATLLAHAMAGSAPKGDGVLAGSARVEGNASGTRWYVKIGGKATTRPVRHGATATYDYALAQELGTVDQPARPFFYPTYRVRKAGIKAAIRKAAADAARQVVNGG